MTEWFFAKWLIGSLIFKKNTPASDKITPSLLQMEITNFWLDLIIERVLIIMNIYNPDF